MRIPAHIKGTQTAEDRQAYLDNLKSRMEADVKASQDRAVALQTKAKAATDNKKSQVMVKAWEIAKDAVKAFGGVSKQYIGEALRMAWGSFKPLQDIISKLLAGGAKEWAGGANHRLYLTEAQKLDILGLSGVKNATRHGDKISNSQAQKLMMQAGDRNFYFDMVTKDWSDFAKKII
jgi:hypothetical protein